MAHVVAMTELCVDLKMYGNVVTGDGSVDIIHSCKYYLCDWRRLWQMEVNSQPQSVTITKLYLIYKEVHVIMAKLFFIGFCFRGKLM